MKILLVANYRPDGQESMQRFAAMLAEGLRREGHDVRVLAPQVWLGLLFQRSPAWVKWAGYFDKLVRFPMGLRKQAAWADVVHICDHSNAFYSRLLHDIAHVVTCHDLLAVRSALDDIPEHETRFSGRLLQRLIVYGLRCSRNIACVSSSTRADVLRIARGDPSRVSVIYNGLNYDFHPMAPEEAEAKLRRFGVSRETPFLLHVGGNQWYKNRIGVLRIFYALTKITVGKDLKLVMIGKPWTGEIRDYVIGHELGERVMEVVGVDGEELRAFYSLAKALVFPSLYEGFGWPVVEAQACGCPVFTSNRPPMTEVGGTAAQYIDPMDPDTAAETIGARIDSVYTLRASSLENAARFSTGNMIRQYIALYERVRSEQHRCTDSAIAECAPQDKVRELNSITRTANALSRSDGNDIEGAVARTPENCE